MARRRPPVFARLTHRCVPGPPADPAAGPVSRPVSRRVSRARPGAVSALLAGLVAVALTGAAGSTPAGAAPPAASTAATVRPVTAAVPTTGFRWVDVPGAHGVVLKANVIAPTTAGPHPAIVFISSWGLNDLEYLAQARVFAARGYVVVSYTPRGWWASGGEIDTAGPKDLADLSRVIDWTVANTTADPARIGAGGISYGAGIALLGSAADARIRAVVAMSGWTDLTYSLYGDQTRHLQSAGLLKIAAELLGNPGPELSGKLADFFADRNTAEVQAWARERSVATRIDAINANRPAVMMANSWGDTIFPPNQLVDFYGRLTGPKRLELGPGDHAVAEAGGLLGLDNRIWDSAYRWFDKYLAGIDTPIAGEGPVVLRRIGSSVPEFSRDWAAISRSTTRFGLGPVRWWDGTGPLGGAPTTDWTKQIRADVNTTADGGVVLLTNGLNALLGTQQTVWLPSVDRDRAGVWVAARQSSTMAIRGIPKLNLRLANAASRGTVIAYLYDLDRVGTARLITSGPATWLGPDGPASARTVDLALPAVAYDLPAGHSLTLVVDTVDPLYFDANEPRSTVTFAGGSYVDIPVK